MYCVPLNIWGGGGEGEREEGGGKGERERKGRERGREGGKGRGREGGRERERGSMKDIVNDLVQSGKREEPNIQLEITIIQRHTNYASIHIYLQRRRGS